MISARGLSKRYGTRRAVDDLTFEVSPGVVTGFLGPNGAGKSTTMRLVLGLDAPSSGSVTVNGARLRDSPAPLREVGALLEARGVHPARSARSHLLSLAATHSLPSRRVDEVLALVGLEDVARSRAGRFSLGMGQRLGIASALLGDPSVLVLDEPGNGLDPEGVLWLRALLRSLADEGRTVLVSSHLLGEVEAVADHLLVVGRGRLLASASPSELVASLAAPRVRLRVPLPDRDRARSLLGAAGLVVSDVPGVPALEVDVSSTDVVGDVLGSAGVGVRELSLVSPSLEDAFLALTRDSVEFEGHR